MANSKKAQVVIFTANRYLTYLVQFIKTILIAKILGPYLLGIWAFINLSLQYLGNTNLGIQYSLNVLLSTKNEKDRGESSSIFMSSLFINLVIGLVLLISALIYRSSGLILTNKYQVEKFIYPILIFSILQQINQLFISLYRTHGRLYKIGIYELSMQLALIPCVLFFRAYSLIYVLLWVPIIIQLLSIAAFSYKCPIDILGRISVKKCVIILRRGVLLLVYNMSYYFILISSITLVSICYSVEDMGFFSLANSFSQATLLGLGAITWAYYSKILSILRSGVAIKDARIIINKIRYLYIRTNYLIIFSVIVAFPVLLSVMKPYAGIAKTFNILILGQGLLTSTIGYADLAIARGKETRIAVHGLITIIINVSLGIICYKVVGLSYEYIALTTLISILYYLIMVMQIGHSILGDRTNILRLFREALPSYILVPFLLILIGNYLKHAYYYVLLGYVIFIWLNHKQLVDVLKRARKMIINPSLLAIENID